MKKTLGLDLGSNSLGWAILDNDTGAILDSGVLVFPEGINPADDSLQTPAAIRRAARMARRIKFHRFFFVFAGNPTKTHAGHQAKRYYNYFTTKIL